MDSMVERVADAILKHLIAEGEYIKDLGDGLIKIDSYIDLGDIARAAIEAMREPTEDQVNASAMILEWYKNVNKPTLAREAYIAAINAALKEQEKVG